MGLSLMTLPAWALGLGIITSWAPKIHAADPRDDEDLKRGCESGKAADCLAYGQRLEKTNLLQAIDLYQGACKRGLGPACTSLGRIDERTDSKSAKINYEKGCALGTLGGCENLGLLLLSEKQSQQAKPWFKKACRLGGARSCVEVEVIEQKPGAEEKRVAVYQSECDQNYAWSCSHLGYLKEQSKRPDEAKKLFEKACSLGNQYGCERKRDVEWYARDPGDMDRSITLETLDNGLVVAYLASPSSEKVRVELEIEAGWNQDPQFSPETAHHTEHAAFRDSERTLTGFFDLLRQEGGTGNGTTYPERTIFHAAMPSVKAVWLLEQFASLVRPRQLQPADLDKVRDEIRLELPLMQQVFGELSTPDQSGVWAKEFDVLSYREGFWHRLLRLHRTPSNQHIQSFFNRYYVARNMRLFVVGDIDPKELSPLIRKLFGSLPEGSPAHPESSGKARAKPFFQSTISWGAPRITLGIKADRLEAEDVALIQAYFENLAGALMKTLRSEQGKTYGVTYHYEWDRRRTGYGYISFESRASDFQTNLSFVKSLIRDETQSGGLTDEKVAEMKQSFVRSLNRRATDLVSLATYARTRVNFRRAFHTESTTREVLEGMDPAQIRARMAKLFREQNALTMLDEPPFWFAGDSLVVFAMSVVLAWRVARRAFRRPSAQGSRLRYLVRTKGPFTSRLLWLSLPLVGLYAFGRVFGELYEALKITRVFETYPRALDYLCGFADTFGTVFLLLALLSAIPKWLRVEEGRLVIKSWSYGSVSLPLDAIEAIRSCLPSELGQKWRSTRLVQFTPWRPGLLISSTRGPSFFLGVADPASAAAELTRILDEHPREVTARPMTEAISKIA